MIEMPKQTILHFSSCFHSILIFTGVVLQSTATIFGSVLILITIIKNGGTSSLEFDRGGLFWSCMAGLAVGLAEILSFCISGMGVHATQSIPIIIGGSISIGTVLGLLMLGETIMWSGWLGIFFWSVAFGSLLQILAKIHLQQRRRDQCGLTVVSGNIIQEIIHLQQTCILRSRVQHAILTLLCNPVATKNMASLPNLKLLFASHTRIKDWLSSIVSQMVVIPQRPRPSSINLIQHSSNLIHK